MTLTNPFHHNLRSMSYPETSRPASITSKPTICWSISGPSPRILRLDVEPHTQSVLLDLKIREVTIFGETSSSMTIVAAYYSRMTIMGAP